MRRFAAALALFLCTVTASCAFLLDTDELGGTGDGAGGTGGAQPIALADAPATVAAAICAAYARCLGPAVDLMFFEEDCVQSTTFNLQDTIFATIQASIDAGKTIYHPEKMPACVAAYETRNCAVVGSWPPECANAVEGTVPVDGECAMLTECVGMAFCDTNKGCPGTCTELRKENEPCLHGGYCDAGLACWSGKCTPLPSQGQECGGNVRPYCHLGLLCIGDREDTGKPGKCFAPESIFTSADGVGCAFESGPLCLEGLHCKVESETAGTCTQGASNAGPCSLAIPDQCPEGQYCKLGVISSNGQCTAIPGPNQPCAEGLVLKPPCQAEYRCVGGLCKPMARLGEVCGAHEQCYSEYCNGVCTVPGSCY